MGRCSSGSGCCRPGRPIIRRRVDILLFFWLIAVNDKIQCSPRSISTTSHGDEQIVVEEGVVGEKYEESP
jgi:hypothetical protein